MKRRIVLGSLGIVFSFLWIAAMWFFLGEGSTYRSIAFGDKTPISLQSLMWIAFFLGLGELLSRWLDVMDESKQIFLRYLPEDDKTVLQAKDLGEYFQRVHAAIQVKPYYLPKLISRIILQFQSSKSIEQANTLLTTSIDFYANEIELRYSLLKYLSWLIPTLGFIGTVVGIMNALELVGSKGVDQIEYILTDVVKLLGVAFNTTLIALVLSAILIYFIGIVQSREEYTLNHSGQYCIDNLINRLYIK